MADQVHIDVPRLLDGAAAEAVKTLLPLNYRQQHGIFFSGHEIATLAATQLFSSLVAGKTVFDPACGAGDLLLAAARQMPLQKNLIATIQNWTQVIGGCDIHNEFVQATRMRLFLLARSRHIERGDINASVLFQSWMFSQIECLDYLKSKSAGRDYSCIIANPPFGYVKVPKKCSWSTGQTQLAAVFLDAIVERSHPTQHIVAILPDVLRSGSRYGRWRGQICERSSHVEVLPYGRFDEQTDVDVFLLDIKATDQSLDKASVAWPSFHNASDSQQTSNRLRDKYEVRIGSVVPHRLTKRGKWAPYLCVKTAPPFSETTPTNRLRFTGTLFHPPFLVIRRTSNPADEHRIIPTIVRGENPVAVENHLIAIFPKSNDLSSCISLFKHLTSPQTRNWIDNAIRCRHITKQILLELPIGDI